MNLVKLFATGSPIRLSIAEDNTGDINNLSQYEENIIEITFDENFYNYEHITPIVYFSSPMDVQPSTEGEVATDEYEKQFTYKMHLTSVTPNVFRVHMNGFFEEFIIGEDNKTSKLCVKIIPFDMDTEQAHIHTSLTISDALVWTWCVNDFVEYKTLEYNPDDLKRLYSIIGTNESRI